MAIKEPIDEVTIPGFNLFVDSSVHNQIVVTKELQASNDKTSSVFDKWSNTSILVHLIHKKMAHVAVFLKGFIR